jgi:RNA polymerase sigma-70 factor (ECF subfamily)
MDSPRSETVPPPAVDLSRWFEDEVQPHDAQLKAYLRGAFPSVRDVEDVAQESYLRVWRARAAHPIRSGRAFLFRVARNLALDFARHERASPLIALGSLADLPVVEERADAAELLTRDEKARLLGQALAALPDRCREILFLHKIKGLSQREVALHFGIAEKTVANQIALGVKRCEDFFRRHGIEFF